MPGRARFALLAPLVAGAVLLVAASSSYPAATGSAVVARIATGGKPCGIVGAAGSLWVSDAIGDRVVRIDPAANAVRGRLKVDAVPCEMTYAYKAVWVVTQSGYVDRIDPVNRRVKARIHVGTTSYDLTAAFGALWVTNRDSATISRIDPRRNRVVRTIRLGGVRPAGIVAGGSGVWVGTDDDEPFLLRIDPRTNRVARVATGVDGGTWLTAAGGAVWVANTHHDTVSRLDFVTRKVTSTVAVGDSPVNLAGVGGDVWVPNDAGDSLTHISTATGRVVETIPMADNPAVVAGAFGDVWVSQHDAGSVWRIHAGG